ncbi:transposase [Paenibacillus thalictri]|uniref:transposase n=1 Tax=Paenibacillus thalictri TaxID=2527873 RepID=UPI003B8364E7
MITNDISFVNHQFPLAADFHFYGKVQRQAGDLRLYSHGRQLLRRAGLNLAECASGKFRGQIKLSKRGDSMLRNYLFLGILNLVRHNEDFKPYMHRKPNFVSVRAINRQLSAVSLYTFGQGERRNVRTKTPRVTGG